MVQVIVSVSIAGSTYLEMDIWGLLAKLNLEGSLGQLCLGDNAEVSVTLRRAEVGNVTLVASRPESWDGPESWDEC